MPFKYEDASVTASKIRAALKAAFPKVKFSVKTSKYAGGSSIRVCYKNGPASEAVSKIAQRFEGAKFNASDDSKSYPGYTDPETGENISGADYVFVDRDVSDDIRWAIAQQIAADFGIVVDVLNYENVRLGGDHGQFLSTMINRQLQTTSF